MKEINYEDYSSSAHFGQHGGGVIQDYYEDIFVGYRWFESKQIPVAYPFGHGLSYTTFDYSDLQLETTEQGIQATLQLTNTGKYDAEEACPVGLALEELV